jgi:hypothetical protein
MDGLETSGVMTPPTQAGQSHEIYGQQEPCARFRPGHRCRRDEAIIINTLYREVWIRREEHRSRFKLLLSPSPAVVPGVTNNSTHWRRLVSGSANPNLPRTHDCNRTLSEEPYAGNPHVRVLWWGRLGDMSAYPITGYFRKIDLAVAPLS